MERGSTVFKGQHQHLPHRGLSGPKSGPSPLPIPLSPEGRHSLARFIQKPPSGALTAHEDVLLQGLLVKHPVAHAEGRVTCGKTQHQRGPQLGRSPARHQ